MMPGYMKPRLRPGVHGKGWYAPQEATMIRHAFAKQEAALRRIQARLRAANHQIQALSERLQAQGRQVKRKA